MKDKQENLLRLIAALEKHSQRATYTAVAGVVELSPLSVMRGLVKSPHCSWVVSKQNHEPTGYSKNQWHPQLKSNSSVISSAAELASWWEKHP
jgi:hypothetical protein